MWLLHRMWQLYSCTFIQSHQLTNESAKYFMILYERFNNTCKWDHGWKLIQTVCLKRGNNLLLKFTASPLNILFVSNNLKILWNFIQIIKRAIKQISIWVKNSQSFIKISTYNEKLDKGGAAAQVNTVVVTHSNGTIYSLL